MGAHSIEALADESNVRQLIINREWQKKKNQARLSNPKMLEQWGGASGTNQLDYRWNRPVKFYINDLVTKLNYTSYV